MLRESEEGGRGAVCTADLPDLDTDGLCGHESCEKHSAPEPRRSIGDDLLANWYRCAAEAQEKRRKLEAELNRDWYKRRQAKRGAGK